MPEQLKVADGLRGKFVVFDGPDGGGKSTQRQLLGQRLEELGLTVVHCKDPGGTVIGDRIRHVLLDYDLSEMDVRCETFLFMASRAQLVGQLVEPALKRGDVVLCDRFISATCSYQGAAGYDVKRVIEVGQYAVSQTWPDLTIILDVPVKQGFQRTHRKPPSRQKNDTKGQHTLFDDVKTDAMESRSLSFHNKVRENFLKLPKFYPKPVEIVDGSGSTDEVQERVWEALQRADL